MGRSFLKVALDTAAKVHDHVKARKASSASGNATTPRNAGVTEDGLCKTSFASFRMPSAWSLSKAHSGGDRVILIPNGSDEHRSSVDHIQIGHGTCPYGIDEVDRFAHAILHQLTMRHQEFSSLSANGHTRDDGVRILQYRIETQECLYTQFYVVGDREYVLITEMDFSSPAGNESARKALDDAAKIVVNSCSIA